MSTETTQPLSLLHVDFDDLYARHLGRHSQFGINVAHLAALYGLWFGVYAAIYQTVLLLDIAAGWLVIVALAATYLAFVAINAPYRVSIATAVLLAFFAASVLALPRLPSWSILPFVLMVPVFYKLQAWTHKIWNIGADMTEFNRRFPPGRALTSILLIYEVPICLNYLIFSRKDWRR
ncbi:MAG: hypothetical protein ACLQVF_05970 [Isosphaeraceae bacterium]